jgi:hypothetical protein
LTVEGCTLSLDGDKEFFVIRLIDDAEDDFAGFFDGDGDGKPGKGMGKVGSAVEGVDDPAKGAGGVWIITFFGKDIVLGKACLDDGDNRCFGFAVGFADEVLGAFLFDVQAGAELAAEQDTGGAGCGQGGLFHAEFLSSLRSSPCRKRVPQPPLVLLRQRLGRRTEMPFSWRVSCQ